MLSWKKKKEMFMKLGLSDFLDPGNSCSQGFPRVEMTYPSCISQENQEILSVPVHYYFPLQISEFL